MIDEGKFVDIQGSLRKTGAINELYSKRPAQRYAYAPKRQKRQKAT